MKTLARKVEEFVAAAIGETSFPQYFSTFGDNVKTRPFVGVSASTGWNSKYEYKHGERTATVMVNVESNADDTAADTHDEISAVIEKQLGDMATVTTGAAGIQAFTLVFWTPGESQTTVEDRVRTTLLNYTARVRDDNRNNT